MKPKNTKEAFEDLNKAFSKLAKSIDYSLGATDKISKPLSKIEKRLRPNFWNRSYKKLEELGSAASWAIHR